MEDKAVEYIWYFIGYAGGFMVGYFVCHIGNKQ